MGQVNILQNLSCNPRKMAEMVKTVKEIKRFARHLAASGRHIWWHHSNCRWRHCDQERDLSRLVINPFRWLLSKSLSIRSKFSLLFKKLLHQLKNAFTQMCNSACSSFDQIWVTNGQLVLMLKDFSVALWSWGKYGRWARRHYDNCLPMLFWWIISAK
jgi:hypothetical protein